MSRIAATRAFWILVASCTLWLSLVTDCLALSWYWGSHPDKERLVLVLDRPAEGYALERTGRQTLTLTLPAGENADTLRQQPGTKPLQGAALLSAPGGNGRTVTIPVRTPAFGYISTSVSGNKIVVDLFNDPIGARWKPQPGAGQPEPAVPVRQTPPEGRRMDRTAGQTAAKPAETSAAAPAQPNSTPQQQKPSSPSPAAPVGVEPPGTRDLNTVLADALQERTFREMPPAASNATPPVSGTPSRSAAQTLAPAPASRTGVSGAQNASNGSGQPAPVPSTPAQPAPIVNSPPERPFFAVPYTYRSRINRGGLEEWQDRPVPQTPPVVVDSPMPYAEGGGMRAPVAANGVPPTVPQAMTANRTAPQPQDEKKAAAVTDGADGQSAGQQRVQSDTGAQRQTVTPPVRKPETAASSVPSDQPASVTPTTPVDRPSGGDGPEYAVRAKVARPGEVATVRRAPSAPTQTSAASAGQPTPAQPAGDGRFTVSDQVPPAPEYPDLKTDLSETEPKVATAPVQVPEPQLEQVVSNAPQPPEPQVVYVDKDGNPIPPPPKPSELIFQAQAALNNGDAATALEQFKAVKKMPKLTDEERAQVLNGIADATYAVGKDDLLANYENIIQTSTEAMNFNLKSDSVPGHLMRIGLTNMKIGNEREAEAYFNILRRNHPNSDLIPLTYYYWGDHYFKKGDWQKAADNYQYVVQNYPDSKFVREAGVGLARALYSLGFYEQAFQIVDYVEKRWPRFYVEYPPFLSQMGDVEYRMNKLEKARITYWTYYNIDPDGDEADMILARLGDLYLEQGEGEAAREVYEEAARKFPERDGGLISLMRLAEEGVFDTPTITDMFSVFDRPYNLRPLQIYTKIIEDHPDSGLVPLARLKKAMWYLWNKEYPEALATATAFTKQHPGHELTGRVKEVALKAFNVMVADNIREGNYERILQMWDQFPIVRGQDTELAPESRIALGLSYWKKKQPSKALEAIDPFFRGLKVPEMSEMALNLALSIYLDNERWNDVLNLGRRIEQWELNPESQRQLNYAKALAHENLGEHDKAAPLWATLSDAKDVPLEEEAYTLYFLTREAERKEDWETAYRHAQQALTDFRNLGKSDSEKADPQKIKDLLGSLMDITERTGRLKESLDWAKQYAQTVEPGDPDYPGLQYRIAGLYRKNANLEQWRDILTKLRDGAPDSLYGRMAASELRTYDLTEGASKFSPTGRL